MKRLPSPPVLLSPAEERLLSAYRRMDVDAKQSIISIAEGWAVGFPCRDSPTLRIIAGGAK